MNSVIRIFSVVVLIVFVFGSFTPSQAQPSDASTYRWESGTRIDIPNNWVVDDSGDFFVMGTGSTRVLVIDYPQIGRLIPASNPTLNQLVRTVSAALLDVEPQRGQIAPFIVSGRTGARFDLRASENAAQTAVIAVRFSNDEIGILIAIDVPNSTLNDLLRSFDNTAEAAMRGDTEGEYALSAHLFSAGGRVLYPTAWSAVPGIDGRRPFLRLQSPDEALFAILFDLSNEVDDSSSLRAVLAEANIDFDTRFDGIALESRIAETFRIDGRSALRYTISAQPFDEVLLGELYIVSFRDSGTGLLAVYGDLATYRREIETLLASFDRLGSLLDYVN